MGCHRKLQRTNDKISDSDCIEFLALIILSDESTPLRLAPRLSKVQLPILFDPQSGGRVLWINTDGSVCV